jgi:hypothetical protein
MRKVSKFAIMTITSMVLPLSAMALTPAKPGTYNSIKSSFSWQCSDPHTGEDYVSNIFIYNGDGDSIVENKHEDPIHIPMKDGKGSTTISSAGDTGTITVTSINLGTSTGFHFSMKGKFTIDKETIYCSSQLNFSLAR